MKSIHKAVRLLRPAFEKPAVGSAPATAETAPSRPLYCRACGGLVTHRDHAIEVAGAHSHHFVNPAGFRFHIGCFERAPGCTDRGRACEEHSWFPGHAWIITSCRQCGSHIGWRFVGSQSAFFALILDHMR